MLNARESPSRPGRVRGLRRFIALVFALVASAHQASAERPAATAKGRWLGPSAAGLQTSGLARGSHGRLWTIGDANTTLDGAEFNARLFRIGQSNDRLDLVLEIRRDGRLVLADFEGLCGLGDSGHFIAITERLPEPPQLLVLDEEGAVLDSRVVDLDSSWEGSANERLEGIACSTAEAFLAYERSKSGPRLLRIQVAVDDTGRLLAAPGGSPAPDPLPVAELPIKLEGIYNLNGLHLLRWDDQDLLLGIARNQHSLVRIDLERDASGGIAGGAVERIPIRFVSPDSDRELCWASPEGIVVQDFRAWIISDPPLDAADNYRELAEGEGRQNCESRSRGVSLSPQFGSLTPILFDLPLADALARGPGADEALDSGLSRYDELRREIERAGRAGKVRKLRRLIDEIDRELEEPTPPEVTSCWQLTKGTLWVELSRPENARKIFELLVDTCPIWEALNNLAVLEAADGEFSAAVQHLRLAFAEAGKAQLGEERFPQANLRALLSQSERPSLSLAGYVRECSGTPTPRAACGGTTPSPEEAADRGQAAGATSPEAPEDETTATRDESSAQPPEGQPAVDPDSIVEAPVREEPRVEELPPGGAEDTASAQQAIREAIEAWASAWSDRDFDGYIAIYGPDFPTADTSQEWRASRKEPVTGKVSISVTLENLEVSTEVGGQPGDMTASFSQTYRAEMQSGETMCELTEKEWVLRRFSDGWKVIEESKDDQNCP